MGKLKEYLHQQRQKIATELDLIEVNTSPNNTLGWQHYKELQSELAKIDALLLEYDNLGEQADE